MRVGGGFVNFVKYVTKYGAKQNLALAKQENALTAKFAKSKNKTFL